ncbi:MAG: NVEALA domain-containing protein [Bacteroides sp.]
MRKKLLKGLVFATFAMIAGYNVYQSNSKAESMNDLMLANVEALADIEYSDCPNGCLNNGNGCFCHYWFPTYREGN